MARQLLFAERMSILNPTTLGVGGAVLLGAGSSIHCMMMCGPLGCAASGTEPTGRSARILAYQGGRAVGYTILGALLGGFGGAIGKAVRIDLRAAVPWLIMVALLLSVVPAGIARLPQSMRLAQLLRKLRAPLQRLPPLGRALAIGAVTPLLPCGVLYSMFPVAIASQSAALGAVLMGGFALGSAPSLLLAQAPLAMLSRSASARLDSWRVVAPLIAAAVLLYRTLAVGPGASCH